MAISTVYVWIVSAGRMSDWPTYGTYNSLLADGFLRGQTYLPIAPAPQLLALPDPYDPAANAPYRLHDAVLYNRAYYLYWGPVPALLLVPCKLLSPAGSSATIGDQYLVFAFAAGTLLFGALLLRRLWLARFPGQPWWALGIGVVGLGFALPLPYVLARASVYEASILGGQCFLMAGLWALVVAFTRPARTGGPAPAADPGPAWLAAGGACMAAAVGCRASLAIAVAAVAGLVTFRLIRRPTPPVPARLGRLAALGGPLVIGAVLLAGYNHVRFGRWLEFGQRYQLAGANLNQPSNPLFAARYLPPNLYSYAVRPVRWSPEFPYAEALPGVFPRWVPIPPNHEHHEQITGLLPGFPYLALAVLVVGPAVRSLRTSGRHARPAGAVGISPAAGVTPTIEEPDGGTDGPILWVLAASILGFAPAVFLVGSTMRYLADLTPGLAVLAGLGVGAGLARTARLGRWWTRAFLAAVGLLLGYGTVLGMLLSATGYYGHFRAFNPDLFDWMRRAL